MTISFFLHIPPQWAGMGWPLQAKYGKPGWFGGISANLALICNNVARGMKQPKDLYPRTFMAIHPLVRTPVTSLHVSCAHSWCGPNVNIYGPVLDLCCSAWAFIQWSVVLCNNYVHYCIMYTFNVHVWLYAFQDICVHLFSRIHHIHHTSELFVNFPLLLVLII